MFFKNYGLTPLEKPHGLIDILINLSQGLCKLIELQEVSTLNVKNTLSCNLLGFFTTNIFVYKTKESFITV
jgi:hypothetical protein